MGEKGNDAQDVLAALQSQSPELASKALEIYTKYQEAQIAKAGADALDTPDA